MILQHKCNKVLFALLEKTLNDDFFKGKIHMNLSKYPPSNESNEIFKYSRSADRNPQMVHVHLELHYKVDPLLELDNLKDVVDSSSRNVDFLNHKSRRTTNVICYVFYDKFLKQGPRHLFFNRLEKFTLELILHEGCLQSNYLYL